MAGYAGYSKSNNAVDAERAGKMVASKLARKLKVSTAAIKAALTPCEWHHSSSWYSQVDYYDSELLLALARGEDVADYDEDELEEARAALELIRKYKDEPVNRNAFRATVKWIEWGGTRRRPKATECEESGCLVEFNGKATYKITLPGGGSFTKREGTNGFTIIKEADNADRQAIAI